MGNASTTAKGAAALANVKSQANTMLNKLDEPDKKKKVIENPETRRKMNQRHRERDTEFKKKKEEREKNKAKVKEMWARNQKR